MNHKAAITAMAATVLMGVAAGEVLYYIFR